MADFRPCVVYAAKSTLDAKGSIPTQLLDGRELAELGGLTVVAEHTDEAASAYHGNRGPGLARAQDDAEGLAREHGECALIIQHSDRLARGDGIQAAHLVEYALWAIKAGVKLRSVQDPQTFGDLLYTVVTGQRNHEDSRRKSLSVKDGLERRARRGLTSGQRIYGYQLRPDGEGLDVDPFEKTIVQRIFREFIAGKNVTHIARSLNADGVRTNKGKMWRQSTVGQMLANPVYIGMVRYHDEVLPGRHEPLIDQRTWDEATALRAARPSQGRGRMPKGSHLFRKGLLRCECGQALTPRTNYVGHQVYVCVGKQINGRDFCDMPHVWRSTIDTAVFNYFTQLGLDLDATRRAVAASSERKLGEIDALLQGAEREAQRAQERYARVRRDYTNGDITAAEWRELREELMTERDAAEAQAARLLASRDEIAAAAEQLDHEHDALRQLAEIRRAIAGDIQAAEGVDAVRAALMRLFEAFVVHRSTPERVHVELMGEYWIEPIIRSDMRGESGPSGMPRPRRLVLDLASERNNSPAGGGARSAPCGPTAAATGARPTASVRAAAASAFVPSCSGRGASRLRRAARRESSSSSRKSARRAQPSSGLGAAARRSRISAIVSGSIRAISAMRSGELPASRAATTCSSSVLIAWRMATKPAVSWRSCGRSPPAKSITPPAAP
jgi:site-specific DNA recombinase